ncbi:hypothetical protein [Aquabacterium sp.]|uniref:hypothetical protein n=1 Tax=Aquabacterium sp. TaxID=1872578 RepID=UPI003D6C9BB0
MNALKWSGLAMAMVAWGAGAQAETLEVPPPVGSPSAEMVVQPAAAPVLVPVIPWALRLPKTDQVTFHGVSSLDRAGGDAGAMVYPGLGVAGFLAAIVTHGVIMESVKSAELTKLQKQADQVLAPYQDILQSFHHRELMQKGLDQASMGEPRQLIDAASEDRPGWVIDSMPVFTMTQDRRAIVLENLLRIRKPDAAPGEFYQNTVRVVSPARQAADLQALWGADQGVLLKDESVRLFAQSLRLGVADAGRSKTEAKAHKTVRYSEGGVEKMERGEVIEDRCGRVVVRTLRGWVMSVPARGASAAAPDAGQCG